VHERHAQQDDTTQNRANKWLRQQRCGSTDTSDANNPLINPTGQANERVVHLATVACLLFVGCVIVLSDGTFSGTATPTKPIEPISLAQVKQNVVLNIDARMQALQAAKNCVDVAADHRALQECRRQETKAIRLLRG
jgi:hypothetical protein